MVFETIPDRLLYLSLLKRYCQYGGVGRCVLGATGGQDGGPGSWQLAELSRGALDQIKRLRVVIRTYSSPDVRVSLSLPESARKLLAGSGVALADPARGRADAIMHIHACCGPDSANYVIVGKQYSGADVGGVILVENEGRPLYVSTLFGEISAPFVIRGFAGYGTPASAPFEEALERGILLPLGMLLGPKALSPLLDQRALEPLLAAVKDDDALCRAAAIEALGKLKDPRAIEPLLAALKEELHVVRSTAIEALGRLKDLRASEPLSAAFRDESLQIGVTMALGELNDPRAVDLLRASLRRGCFSVEVAAHLLGPGAGPAEERTSRQDKQRLMLIRQKLGYVVGAAAKQPLDTFRRTVAHPQPNDLGRMTVKETPLTQVRILGHNATTVPGGVLPHEGIGGGLETHLAHVQGSRVAILQRCWQVRGQVLVEQESHTGIVASLRSRSAAKARQARISSRVRSGKSARISSSVIPPAR